MPATIPEEWRKAVVAILRGRNGRCELTKKASDNWQNTFFDEYDFHLLEVLARWLSQPSVDGEQVFDMTPPCVAYKFFFYHRKTKLFGKVGLHDETVVIVFSAHVPHKGDKL